LILEWLITKSTEHGFKARNAIARLRDPGLEKVRIIELFIQICPPEKAGSVIDGMSVLTGQSIVGMVKKIIDSGNVGVETVNHHAKFCQGLLHPHFITIII